MNSSPPISRPTKYFEEMYEKNSDPWCFKTSSYEKEKYANTLSILQRRQFSRALEIGCSIGVFTEKLAAYCVSLLSTDIVPSAIQQARVRCAHLHNVVFKEQRIPNEWPRDARFDLIVISEVLYFLSPQDIEKTADLVCSTLNDDGHVLLVNYTEDVSEPCNGNEATELFSNCSDPILARLRQKVFPKYRIDLFTKTASPSR